MAPPPSSTISRVITLLLKIVMFTLLLASLVVLVTDTATISVDLFPDSTVHFDDIYTYRYVLASIIIGLVYSLLQTAFSLYHIATGNRLIAGDGAFVFDFYGDKASFGTVAWCGEKGLAPFGPKGGSTAVGMTLTAAISYMVATGSAAGFGATKDLKALADAAKLDLDDYFDKAYASASLLLIAFFCAATLSVFSSYALPKMVN